MAKEKEGQSIKGAGNVVAGRDLNIGALTQHFSADEFQQISITSKEELRRQITKRGILILTDLVGSTKQTRNRPENELREYHEHRIKHLKERSARFGIEWLTHAGDADLLFLPGEDIGPLLDFYQALNFTDPVPAYKELTPIFRMIAHESRFSFTVSDVGKLEKHHVGNHVTLLFRLEKECPGRQLLLTGTAAMCLPPSLPDEFTRAKGKFPPQLREWTEHAPDHLTWLQLPATGGFLLNDLPPSFQERHSALARQVAIIRIFGGLYEDVSMEKNFLNLLLDNRSAADPGSFAQPPMLDLEDHLELRDRKRDEKRSQSRLPVQASQLHAQFDAGTVIGLPGAGKTTILHYLANALLREFDKDPVRERDNIVLLVKCGDLAPSVVEQAIAGNCPVRQLANGRLFWVLAAAFLHPGRPFAGTNGLAEAEQADIADVAGMMAKAWRANSLTLLVDALDEAPSEPVKEFIAEELAPLLQNSVRPPKTNPQPHGRRNRVWLSMRPSEQARIPRDVPRFVVQSLDQDQVRQLARTFWRIPEDWTPKPGEQAGEDLVLYRDFDALLPFRPDVHTVAGTPLTALLVIFYYQFRKQFGHRHELYHLILLFVLLRVWEEVKAGHQSRRRASLNRLFQHLQQPTFLTEEPLVEAQYDLLAFIAWRGLYDERAPGVDQSERSLSVESFDAYMDEWRQDRGERWFQQESFQREMEATGQPFAGWRQVWLDWNLLVSAGMNRLVFIHSTVLEFLGARHLGDLFAENEPAFAAALTKAVERRDRDHLETLPLACSHSFDLGNRLLAALQTDFAALMRSDDCAAASRTLPVRCLADLEMTEQLVLDRLDSVDQRRSRQSALDESGAKDWIYEELLGWLGADEEAVRAHTLRLGKVLPLSRDRFRELILKQPERTGLADGLLDQSPEPHARREFLVGLLSREQMNLFDNRPRPETKAVPETIVSAFATRSADGTESVLQLDRPGDPEDKNIVFHQKRIGGGFLARRTPGTRMSFVVLVCLPTASGSSPAPLTIPSSFGTPNRAASCARSAVTKVPLTPAAGVPTASGSSPAPMTIPSSFGTPNRENACTPFSWAGRRCR